MLKKSFIHIKGVNPNKEKYIWENGVGNWDEINNLDKIQLSNNLKERIKQEIEISRREFERGNLIHFAEKLPRNQHWRMYPYLGEKCCFLDIETTGLSRERDIITLIGIYNGRESKVFIDGKNMNEFAKEISKYDMVITFNGACFDLPFIKSKHANLKIPRFHVDLRYPLKNLGYSGGLKLIEKELGMIRDENIADIDGFEAVRLWKAYKKGDKSALDKLIDYNTSDIENLKPMMDFAYEKMCEKTFGK